MKIEYVQLGKYIKEYNSRNKKLQCKDVYSVTNTQGFVSSNEYFNKEVYSKNLSNYKFVCRNMIAYNPSRVNVGSLAVQDKLDLVIVSPLYIVFEIVENTFIPEFVSLFLHSCYGMAQIDNLTSGSVRDSLKYSALEKIKLPIYEIDKQKKIISNISYVDKLICKCNKQLTLLDELTKSRFIEMFGDPVINTIKWDIQPLCVICDKLTDGTHFSPKSYIVGEYRYITAKNIKLDGFDFSDITYVNADVHNDIYARCNPEYGDVLYIKDGVTAGIAIINTLHEPFSMLSSVSLLKYNRKIINGAYLCSVLNNDHMYDTVRNDMGGAAITRLTIAKINKIQIPVPPLELQNQFADFVTQTDKSKYDIHKLCAFMRNMIN